MRYQIIQQKGKALPDEISNLSRDATGSSVYNDNEHIENRFNFWRLWYKEFKYSRC